METIFSDGRTLEIEKKLKITVFLPQPCYFCTKEITIFDSHKPESLVFHSLDGDHDNWDPVNKRPAHHGCHSTFHQKGKPIPSMRGIPRPPEVIKKITDTKRSKEGKDRAKKGWIKRLAKYGSTGCNPGVKEESAIRGWATYRARNPPIGIRSKEARSQ